MTCLADSPSKCYQCLKFFWAQNRILIHVLHQHRIWRCTRERVWRMVPSECCKNASHRSNFSEDSSFSSIIGFEVFLFASLAESADWEFGTTKHDQLYQLVPLLQTWQICAYLTLTSSHFAAASGCFVLPYRCPRVSWTSIHWRSLCISKSRRLACLSLCLQWFGQQVDYLDWLSAD